MGNNTETRKYRVDDSILSEDLDKRIIEAEEKAENSSADATDGSTDSSVSNLSKATNKRGLEKALVIISAFLVLCAVVVGCMAYISANPIPSSKIIDHRGNYLKLSVMTDDLVYAPVDLAVDIGDYMAEFSIDTTGHIVQIIDNYEGYLCLSYLNEERTKNTEIIIADVIPYKMKISLEAQEALKKPNRLIIEPKTDEDGITTEIGYINLYNQGFMCVIQQVYSDGEIETNVSEMMNTLIDSMLYSKDEYIETTRTVTMDVFNNDTQEVEYVDKVEDYIIYPNRKFLVEFDGLGIYDINSLPGMDGRAGVYFGQDGIYRIYKDSELKPYAYITTVNDPMFENTADTLEPVDGWNNLYYSIYKDDQTSTNYRAFAIQTSRGMYYIKVDEKAPAGFEQTLINMFGIKADDPKIESIVDRYKVALEEVKKQNEEAAKEAEDSVNETKENTQTKEGD